MSGWSWKLGRLAGIDISMHATFVLLLVWVAISHYVRRHRMIDAASGVAFIVALFGIVVLHELGHALTARRFGIRTRDITLLPIGGVARLERMPELPRQEIAVALAGPAVNLALAALLAAIVAPTVWSDVDWFASDFLSRLVWANVGLAVFNLVPAFPMDGGRVLRALLAMAGDPASATRRAAKIAQAIAIVFALLGFYGGNPLLVLIAVFVWMSAMAEAGAVMLRSALTGIPLSRVMVTRFDTLAAGDSVRRAVARALDGFQQHFPVEDGSRVVGVVSRRALLSALGAHGPDATVAAVMRRRIDLVDISEPLDRVLERLQTSAGGLVLVTRAGALAGMVTSENLGDRLTSVTARGPTTAPARSEVA